MSFSSEQKQQILSTQLRSLCCRKAFFQGILTGKGSVEDGVVTVSCESGEFALGLKSLIFDVYKQDAVISGGVNGGRLKRLSFRSSSAESFLTDLYGNSFTLPSKCNGCAPAFLRGLFFSCGRLSDPTKQYSLEFSVRGRTEIIKTIFEDLGLNPKISIKKNEDIIYFRRSSDIEDFLGYAGMNSAAFALMNEKIQSEFRNNANRVANCETNNIEKAVASSVRLLPLLRELDRKGLLSQLPEELEQTARMRMKHDDLSLSQLASLFTPKITKSGLSHRLKSINELAVSLLGHD